jgi:hypothetical protein
MVFVPLSHVLLRLLITHIGLWLGLVVLRVAIIALSLVLCVAVTFSLLQL